MMSRIIKDLDEMDSAPIIDATKFSSWLQIVTAKVISLKELHKNQCPKQLTKQLSEWPPQRMIKDT